MKISELLGNDAQSAIIALDLIEKLTPYFIVEEVEDQEGKVFRVRHEDITQAPEVINILISEDAVEVIKGLTFVLCSTISVFLCESRSPIDHFKLMRSYLDAASASGNHADLSKQYDVIDLLEATEGSSSAYYLKAYGLINKELGTYHVSVSLVSLFYSICVFDLGYDPREITQFLINIIANWRESS